MRELNSQVLDLPLSQLIKLIIPFIHFKNDIIIRFCGHSIICIKIIYLFLLASAISLPLPGCPDGNNREGIGGLSAGQQVPYP